MSPETDAELRLSVLPEYLRRVWQIHDDYLDVLEEWERWQQTYHGEIQVWSTIRSLLVQAREDDDGNLPSVGELLQHLGIEGWTSELPEDERAALWKVVMAADIDPEDDGFDAIRDFWEAEPGLLDELMEDEWTIGLDVTEGANPPGSSIEDLPPEETPFVTFTRAISTRLLLLEYQAQQLRVHLEQPIPLGDDSPYVRIALSEEPLSDADEDDVTGFAELFHDTMYDGESPFWEEFDQKLSFQQQQRLIDKLVSGLNKTRVGREMLSDLVTGGFHDEFRTSDLFHEPSDRETLVNYPQSVFDADGKFAEWADEVRRGVELASLLMPGFSTAATGDGDHELGVEVGRMLYAFHAEPDAGDSIPARLRDGQEIGSDQGQIDPGEFAAVLEAVADKGIGTLADGIASSWKAQHDLSDFADNLPSENISVLHDALRVRSSDSSEDVVGRIVEQLDLQEPADGIELPEKSTWVRAAEDMDRFLTVYRAVSSIAKVIVLIDSDDDPDSWDEYLEDFQTWLGIKDVLALADRYEGRTIAASDGVTRPSARVELNRAIQGVETATVENMTTQLDDLLEQTLDEAHHFFFEMDGIDKTHPFGVEHIGLKLDQAKTKLERFNAAYLQTGELTEDNVKLLMGAIDDVEGSTSQLRANLLSARMIWDQPPSGLESRLTTLEDDIRRPIQNVRSDFRQFASLDISEDLRAVRQIASNWDDPSGRQVAIEHIEQVERQRTELESQRRLYKARNRNALFLRFATRSLIQLGSVLADAIGVVLAVKDVSDALDEKDYGAAMGAGLVGLGSVGMMGAVFLTGPVGWVVGVSSALVLIAGIGTTIAFTDTPVENWVKYTYFGTLRKRNPDSPEHPHWGYSIAYRSALSGRIDLNQYWQRQMAGYYTMLLDFEITEAKLEDDDGLPKLSVGVRNVEDVGYGSVFLIRLLAGDPAPSDDPDVTLWTPHQGLIEVIDEDNDALGIVETWVEYEEPPGGGVVYPNRIVEDVQESAFRELEIAVKNVGIETTLRFDGGSDDESKMTGADFEITLADDKSDEAEWDPLANLLGVDEEKFFREEDELEKYIEVVHAPLPLHAVLDAMPGLSGAEPTEVARTVDENYIAPRKREQLSVDYSGGEN